MNHADPWDEVARLEWEMEVELLAQLERLREAEGVSTSERRLVVDRAHLELQL